MILNNVSLLFHKSKNDIEQEHLSVKQYSLDGCVHQCVLQSIYLVVKSQ